MPRDVVVTVHKTEGECPVFRTGDRIFFRGPEIDLERSDAVCAHALPPLLHYLNALRPGADMAELGLSKGERNTGYVACPDPGPPFTNGGRVIFRLETLEE